MLRLRGTVCARAVCEGSAGGFELCGGGGGGGGAACVCVCAWACVSVWLLGGGAGDV